MSEPQKEGGPGPAFGEAIRRFRRQIGGHRPLPRASRTLPRLKLERRYTSKLVTVLFVMTLVTAGSYLGPRLAGPDTVPAELVGIWTTRSPGYEGRSLALTRDSLVLRASAQEVMGYRVRRVERHLVADGSAYVITAYAEAGGEYNLTLEYRDRQQQIAQGKPVRVLWDRVR